MNQRETLDIHHGIYQRLEENILFSRLDLDADAVGHARMAAENALIGTETQLVAAGVVEEDQFYRQMAESLGLPFLDRLPVRKMRDVAGLDLMLKDPHSIRLQDPFSPAITALVPPLDQLAHLRETIDAAPDLRERLAVTTPSAMRAAVWKCGERRRLRQSVARLAEAMPGFSSRQTMSGRQGFWLGVAAAGFLAAMLLAPEITQSVLHLTLSLLYLATVLFRLAAHLPRRAKKPVARRAPVGAENLPVYTVLVALYRESDVVPQLVRALSRLDWPAAKLVCEAGDAETLEAIGALALPPFMEVVLVPSGEPKTKPKALVYALAGARGEFVTIYDAEDRPHPGQLQAAYRAFREAGPELACLQAPLVITNAGESWLSSLFAAEYSLHFRRFLPHLAAHALPVPLGGTSNHFRREALERSGGWDPFNVTEDADLGLRLHRLGYRVDTIGPPTLEEAPTTRDIWLGQRTRWFKGWMQTFLVSMRDPVELARNLGAAGLLAYLLTTVGMLVSALCHPLLFVSLASIAWRIATADQTLLHGLDLAIIILDFTNLAASYGYFALAGFSMPPPQARHFRWRQALCIPAYWVLLSFASWRALLELYRRPHFWEKTPHRAVKPRAPEPRRE